MTLSEAMDAARNALTQSDYAALEAAARKALELSGIQERSATQWFPKLTGEKRGAALEAAILLTHALLQQGRWREAVQAGWDLEGMDRKRLAPLKLLEAEAYFREGDWLCDTPLHVARQILRELPAQRAGSSRGTRVSEHAGGRPGLCGLLKDRPEGALQAEVYLAAARYARFLAYYEEAAADLRKAGVILKKLPEDKALWAQWEAERGHLELDWKEEAGTARKHFERALEWDADNFEARKGMGDVASMEGRGEEALEWLRPLESGRDPEVLGAIGWTYGSLGDQARAEEYFERALQRSLEWYGRFHPLTGLVLFWFGSFRLSQGERRAEAVELLERSVATFQCGLHEDHPWVEGAREMVEELRPPGARVYASPNAEWYEEVRRQVEGLRQARVESLQLDVQPPAAVEDVEAVERVLGKRLPESFRDVLLGFARAVRIFYYAEDRGILGCLEWDLERLLPTHVQYLRWEGTQGPEDWTPWRNRLAFLPVGNGDSVTIDLGSEDGAVVYYDHEWGKMQGVALAPNFGEFLRRVLYLGAVGDHSYQEFLGPDGLDVENDRAREWHAWIYGES
ncbi:MAG: tetratricopeptide repeat protein [Bryobacterales bacterium]|nr:tetratricopeptide repeat protein [Bryobacterales bacterium]